MGCYLIAMVCHSVERAMSKETHDILQLFLHILNVKAQLCDGNRNILSIAARRSRLPGLASLRHCPSCLTRAGGIRLACEDSVCIFIRVKFLVRKHGVVCGQRRG